MNWQPYAGVISVSICTVLLYYAFLVRLMVVKISLYREHAARGEDFDRYLSRNPRLHAADRAQLNMLEHLPTFNLVLWLNAWVVSPSSAAAGGTVWLLARAAYPFLVGSTSVAMFLFESCSRRSPATRLWPTSRGRSPSESSSARCERDGLGAIEAIEGWHDHSDGPQHALWWPDAL